METLETQGAPRQTACKKCSGCREVKPITAFGISQRRRDGLNIYCKPCNCAKAKASYKKHYTRWKPKIVARVKAWAKRNPEKRREAVRRYIANGGEEKRRARQKERRRLTGSDKIYRSLNRDKIRTRANGYTAELRPWYVRRLLTRGTPLNPSKLPASLVRAKQQQLQLQRSVCNLQKT